MTTNLFHFAVRSTVSASTLSRKLNHWFCFPENRVQKSLGKTEKFYPQRLLSTFFFSVVEREIDFQTEKKSRAASQVKQ